MMVLREVLLGEMKEKGFQVCKGVFCKGEVK